MELGQILPILLGAAWLLPLASFTLIVLFGQRMGRHGRSAGYLATLAICCSAVLSFTAFILWIATHGAGAAAHHGEHGEHAELAQHAAATHGELKLASLAAPASADDGAPHGEGAAAHDAHDEHGHAAGQGIAYTGDWYTLARFGSLALTVGYYIDALTLAMFCMVTLIASCIHFYALGYMSDELRDEVVDHECLLEDGSHLHRRGRFHRFFQYLSLFCFSMLGLVVAGNALMVFMFWELVGICSYFLIGFYFERKSASNAANKAFIVNRVGDFGMIVGLMALFGALGTFNFGDVDGQPGIFSLMRPAETQHALRTPDGYVTAGAREEVAAIVAAHGGNMEAAQAEIAGQIETWREQGYGYWLMVIAGVGIFCGCVGKSAQFPLHTWLPDAMEGPTPVSALVHSATMVAAGVYLVGRFYPAFVPETLLVIAYIGTITLLLAATIAITATDIKRVLAYSTVSQLGYMMVALGVGGWLAGLFHLITHAFFKSLLFMCSGSVIHACHTNEMTKMGGLRHKMPWTAYTMLVGCLAIIGAGVPFVLGFSGYYSKDAIIAQALSFWQGGGEFAGNPTHGAVFFLAVSGGAAITAFYMFRLWYMTFAGAPRDHHIYDHAHESPKVMYVPLVILSFFAVAVAWPSPWLVMAGGIIGLVVTGYFMLRAKRAHATMLHEPREHGGAPPEGDHTHGAMAPAYDAHQHPHHESEAGGLGLLAGLFAAAAVVGLVLWPTGLSLVGWLEMARPAGLAEAGAGGVLAAGQLMPSLAYPAEHASHAPAIHVVATLVAFSTALAGFLLATFFYGVGWLKPEEVRQQFSAVYRLLRNKWYFDELYDALFVRPVHVVSRAIAQFDRRVIDGLIDGSAWATTRLANFDDLIDRYLVDGFVNLLADWTFSSARWLRNVQTGSLRQYVMAIVICTVVLTVLIRWSMAG